jgi:tetratricopeptide (TPR) repeat protein/tRNA A-37 threonylcarbamoyl transferase component Bud32/TolB-like protein
MSHDSGAVRFATGAVIADRYRVERFLGLGGMGEVYEVEDLEIGERVALKTVRHEIADSPRALERLRRELQLSRKVTHPNVCRMFDLGRDAARDVTFLTMEIVRGETLADRIRGKGRMTEAEALPLLRQMAAGLDAAHAAGIVHRDFKSANVMLVGDGAEARAVVTDFGLASRLRPVEDPTATATATLSGGSLVGSPAYMAPEQVEGGEVGPASDLYALGIVAFEMITGKLPFTGDTSVAIAVARLRDHPPAARSVDPGVTPAWEWAIRHAMARHAKDRFPSAAAFVAALERPVRPARPRSRRALAAAAAAAAAVVVVLLAAWVVRDRTQRPVAAAPEPTLAARRSIAVLPFANATGRADSAWLSTALAEMLTTELGAGGDLRAVPGETVSRAKRELSLEESGALAGDTLTRIREGIGADLVASGSFAAVGGSEGRIRVDVRLQDTATGDTVTSFAETGSEAGLFDLVTQAGSKLRASLGAAAPSTPDADVLRAATPSDPAVARLYAEGLAKLRQFDASAAQGLLEKAVALDPDQALIHAALADAWARLGYDGKAAAEAKRAVELSEGLPREIKLRLEAQHADAVNDRTKAVDGYAALFAFFPDNVEYGLSLAGAQQRAGKTDEALKTIEALRRVARDDPRLDVAEARSLATRGESARVLDVTARAAEKAGRTGSVLVAAEARTLLASALLEQGRPPEAREAARLAQDAYERQGDRQGAVRAISVSARTARNAGDFAESVRLLESALEASRSTGARKTEAWVLDEIASTYYQWGKLEQARARYEQAIAILRETDSRPELASALGNLANILDNEGDLNGALTMHTQAMELFREVGNRGGVARSLHNIALVRLEQGDLDGAERDLVEAIAAKRELGHKRSIAFSERVLGDVLVAKDKLIEARRHYNEALAIRESLGEKLTAAQTRMALANLDLQEGRPVEAAATAAELATVFKAEGQTDDAATALILAATALAQAGRVPEAETALTDASKLAEKSTFRSMALGLAIAAARVDAAAGRKALALKRLDGVRAEANRYGLVGYQLEARLARVELDPSDRTSLVRDATAAGFALIARKAGKERNVP